VLCEIFLKTTVDNAVHFLLLQLFKCFNQLGICQGVAATRRNIDVIVNEADSTLKEWRQQAESEMTQVGLLSLCRLQLAACCDSFLIITDGICLHLYDTVVSLYK